MTVEKINKNDELKFFLKQYCQERNHFIKNVASWGTRYEILDIKNKEKENLTDYFIECYLEAKENELHDRKEFFKFIRFLIKKDRLDLADKQLKHKRPSNNEDFEKYFNQLFNFFRDRKDVIKDFVLNKKFFDTYPEKIKELCDYFTDPDDIKGLFENVFKTKWFSNLNNQVEVYKLFKTHIGDNEEYHSFFNKINLKEPSKESDAFNQPVFMYCVEFTIDFKKLMSASVDQKITLNGYRNFVNIIANYYNSFTKEESVQWFKDVSPELTIERIQSDEKVKQDIHILRLFSKKQNLDKVIGLLKYSMLNLKHLKNVEKLNENSLYDSQFWKDYLKENYTKLLRENLTSQVVTDKKETNNKPIKI